uniref:Uncharacterized protein n=1 Tax=Tetranychus urticae TaxID=32264 RepID=T1K0G5_TETUR
MDIYVVTIHSQKQSLLLLELYSCGPVDLFIDDYQHDRTPVI